MQSQVLIMSCLGMLLLEHTADIFSHAFSRTFWAITIKGSFESVKGLTDGDKCRSSYLLR